MGSGTATNSARFAGFMLLFHPTGQIPLYRPYDIKIYWVSASEVTARQILDTAERNRMSQLTNSIAVVLGSDLDLGT